MSRPGGSGSEADVGGAGGQGELHPRCPGDGECPHTVSVPDDPPAAGPDLPTVSRHADVTDRVQLLRVLRGLEISPE